MHGQYVFRKHPVNYGGPDVRRSAAIIIPIRGRISGTFIPDSSPNGFSRWRAYSVQSASAESVVARTTGPSHRRRLLSGLLSTARTRNSRGAKRRLTSAARRELRRAETSEEEERKTWSLGQRDHPRNSRDTSRVVRGGVSGSVKRSIGEGVWGGMGFSMA